MFDCIKLCVLTIVFAFVFCAAGAAGTVFPGADWEEKTPESQGVASSKLNEAVNYLSELSGKDRVKYMVVVRNGYIIWKGTKYDTLSTPWVPSCGDGSIASIYKCIYSTIYGLLDDDGRCTVEDYAKDYEPRLNCQYPEYGRIKLKHLLTYTSGYDDKGGKCDQGGTYHIPAPPLFEPGTRFSYWDPSTEMLSLVMTKIAKEPLDDFFTRRIGNPIGLNHAKFHLTKKDHRDGYDIYCHTNATAAELAKFGHLILNRGNWNGKRVISEKWLKRATKTQVPISMPVADNCRSRVDRRGVYGYHWYNNNIRPTGRRYYPDAPICTIHRSGWPKQRLIIIPEWNMVIVRLGRDNGSDRLPRRADAVWSSVLKTIGEGITGSHVVITSQPRDRKITEGQTATFSVTATGATPISYQWQKNCEDIPGATSLSYTTSTTTLSDNGGKYRCIVTNSAGYAISDEAILLTSK